MRSGSGWERASSEWPTAVWVQVLKSDTIYRGVRGTFLKPTAQYARRRDCIRTLDWSTAFYFYNRRLLATHSTLINLLVCGWDIC